MIENMAASVNTPALAVNCKSPILQSRPHTALASALSSVFRTASVAAECMHTHCVKPTSCSDSCPCSLIPGQKDIMPEMTVNPKDKQHPSDKMLATTFQGTRSIKVLEVPKPQVTDLVRTCMRGLNCDRPCSSGGRLQKGGGTMGWAVEPVLPLPVLPGQ